MGCSLTVKLSPAIFDSSSDHSECEAASVTSGYALPAYVAGSASTNAPKMPTSSALTHVT